MRASLAAVCVLAVVAGCSGDGGREDARAPAPDPTTAAETRPDAETGETETTETDGERREGPLRLRRVASGFTDPVYLTAAPGQPGRLYVVERGGRVRVLRDGRARPGPFLDVSDEIVAGGEQGLLGLAFHPDFERNRLLYVHYTNTAGDTRVLEYRSGEDGSRVDESTARVLFEADQPYSNHNGGQLAFGPDGRLWLGLGDGGSGGDPENRAQSLSGPLGKIHAIDVDVREPRSEIVAYGLRNPWRFSFDRESGDLWIGDVGQSEFEEIDRLPGDRVGDLVNFGWDVFEGRERFEAKEPNPEGRLVDPVFVYPHSEGCSVTGGYVYRGSDIESAQGRYFFGDYCSGRIWSVGPRGHARTEPFQVEALVSFGEDVAGELYVVSLGGTIYRLAA